MIRLAIPLVLLCLACMLAACGNKGDLIKPSADSKSTGTATSAR